jgi:ADP-ribose pyrophosphatase
VPSRYKLCLVHWRKLSERVVYDRYRRVVSRTFELPGGETADYEVIAKADIVAVLALTDGNEVILARQFRPGPEEILLELPGGLIDEGECPSDAARKELLEETGYQGRMAAAGTILEDAYAIRTKHAFIATGCRKVADAVRGELTEPVLMPLADFREHLRGGRLTDVDVGYRALDELGLL